MHLLFPLHLLSTFALFGLIWFVQLVHYPLHALVSPSEFPRYQAEHAKRTGYVAAPLMILELLTALALLNPWWRPIYIPASQACFGAILVGLLWLTTFAVQVPLHNRLHRAHDPADIARLIHSNWLRTLLWTARSTLLLLWLGRAPG